MKMENEQIEKPLVPCEVELEQALLKIEQQAQEIDELTSRMVVRGPRISATELAMMAAIVSPSLAKNHSDPKVAAKQAIAIAKAIRDELADEPS